MNITAIKEKLNLNIFVMGNDKAEVLSCYAGDLLSVVMGHAKQGALWLTVMTNVNVAAIAKLTDMSAVLLCENANPDEHLLLKAKQQGITLLGTNNPVFETAVEISKLI